MLVILDAGHNEKVAGKKAPDNSLYEWIFNNEMQYKIKKRLEEHNIKVYLTNPSPSNKDEIGLTKRTELANSYWIRENKPKALFISLHANAYGINFNSARGTETYIAKNASNNSKNAAKLINDNIFDTFKILDINSKNRGVKTYNYTVIYKTNMPSILVEYGFYTNKDDLKILKNNQNELTEATIKGICDYFDINYKALENKSTTNKVTYYRVIAGSYTNKINAEVIVNKLNNIGYSSFVSTFTKNSTLYYRVVAGSYSIKSNADIQINKLKSNGYNAFIEVYKK